MSITCSTCGYDGNPDNAEFCDACGAELNLSAQPQSNSTTPETTPDSTPDTIPFTPPAPNSPPPVESQDPVFTPPAPNSPPPVESQDPVFTPPPAPGNAPPAPPSFPISETVPPAAASSPAICLTAKQTNAPQIEFPVNQISLIGVFDPDSGPVDIDLESFIGGETVSRHHAEIYPDAGTWMVKDLGSTNGVFIKPQGQPRFSARITRPTPLNPGDEVAFGKVQFSVQAS